MYGVLIFTIVNSIDNSNKFDIYEGEGDCVNCVCMRIVDEQLSQLPFSCVVAT